MTKEEIEELRRLEASATPGPWRSMRDGNQYVKTQYISTAKLVGASRIEGVLRPWNPYAYVAFGMPAEKHEVVRFIDADADFVCAARNALPGLLSTIESLQAQLAEAEAKLVAVGEHLADWQTSHNMHWDREGTSGTNCPACIEDRKLRAALRAISEPSPPPEES